MHARVHRIEILREKNQILIVKIGGKRDLPLSKAPLNSSGRPVPVSDVCIDGDGSV